MADYSGYLTWLEENKVDHAHCIMGCEKPQPFALDDGKLYCGKHWHDDGVLMEMVPCVPEICD